MALGPTVTKKISAVAIVAGTPATVWTPASGKTPVIAINGSDVRERLGDGILSATADNPLKLDVSANSTVSGYVFGTEE